VVLVDIFHFSEICEQAPSLSHPEVDESWFYNLPSLLGPQAHPFWVRGRSESKNPAMPLLGLEPRPPSS
jgi:hypothetical protein